MSEEEEGVKKAEFAELKRLLKERAAIKAKIAAIDKATEEASREGVRRVRLKSQIAETEREHYSISEISKLRQSYESQLAAIARRIRVLAGDGEFRQHQMRLV